MTSDLRICIYASSRPSSPPNAVPRPRLFSRRCFLAWCTQFQITHVFLEATTGEDGSSRRAHGTSTASRRLRGGRGSRRGVTETNGVPRAGSTPFWRKAGTSLFTYKSRAWRMRYAQAQFQLVKCASRRRRRRARSTVEYDARRQGRHGARLRRGRQPAHALFRVLDAASYTTACPQNVDRASRRWRGGGGRRSGVSRK